MAALFDSGVYGSKANYQDYDKYKNESAAKDEDGKLGESAGPLTRSALELKSQPSSDRVKIGNVR